MSPDKMLKAIFLLYLSSSIICEESQWGTNLLGGPTLDVRTVCLPVMDLYCVVLLTIPQAEDGVTEGTVTETKTETATRTATETETENPPTKPPPNEEIETVSVKAEVCEKGGEHKIL